jgi:hypothetical protein
MRETLYLGSSPCDEKCAQVGAQDYAERSAAECRAYKAQLHRIVIAHLQGAEPPDGFRITTKQEPHDYGTYLEVVAQCSTDDALELGYWLDGALPEKWDEQARVALGTLIDSSDCQITAYRTVS